VRLLTKQHAGVAAKPVVSAGQRVPAGTTVARMDAGALGADIHASIGGRVTKVTADFVEIET
jgi:Na+-translocating ferredoxin:NAD+ oxidoreductase RnfC subunit